MCRAAGARPAIGDVAEPRRPLLRCDAGVGHRQYVLIDGGHGPSRTFPRRAHCSIERSLDRRPNQRPGRAQPVAGGSGRRSPARMVAHSAWVARVRYELGKATTRQPVPGMIGDRASSRRRVTARHTPFPLPDIPLSGIFRGWREASICLLTCIVTASAACVPRQRFTRPSARTNAGRSRTRRRRRDTTQRAPANADRPDATLTPGAKRSSNRGVPPASTSAAYRSDVAGVVDDRQVPHWTRMNKWPGPDTANR